MSRVSSGPMMSCTSPPEEKLPPFERDDDRLDVVDPTASARKQSRSSAYESNVSGFLRSGRRERDDGDAAVDPPVEVRRLKIPHAAESFTGDKEMRKRSFCLRSPDLLSAVKGRSHVHGASERDASRYS